MKWILAVVAVVALMVLGFALWVRLAPVDTARWHVGAVQEGVGHMPRANGHLWRGEIAGPDAMARVDAVIQGTPRTKVIAGSVQSGMVTYQTRSALWGFPDYTTLRDAEGLIEINSRLRFGQSDLGVNRARIEGWLEALGQGG